MKKVLLIGSGCTATQVSDYSYHKTGWTIVTINHGWLAYPEYDYWVAPTDYAGKKDPDAGDRFVGWDEYIIAQNAYGGEWECGMGITLAAAYWALHTIKPSVIGFLGCDMNYTPGKNGETAFYGIGIDVQNNGCPDPFAMAARYSIKDPIEKLYTRFADMAALKNCDVVNFSKIEKTLLPYKKTTPDYLRRTTEDRHGTKLK